MALCSYLIDGQHVEVRDVILLGVLDPGTAFHFINQLAHVFVNKLALRHRQGY